MANELNFQFDPGLTLEAQIFANNWVQQGANIALVEGAAGLYVGSVPGAPAISDGVYEILFLDTIGPPVNEVVGRGTLYWASNAEDREGVFSAQTAISAAIAALNNLSSADVQAAMTAQGYTAARAILLDNLVNLDTSVLGAANAILAAIGALNDLSIPDVQTALDNQGLTAVRAALLDNLDVAVSTRAVAGDDMGLTAATLLAIQAIILSDATPFPGANIDASISTRATVVAVAAIQAFIEGGRDIDFVGNDALGWQRIERDTGGILLRRYNLFDEAGARINETVISFIGRSGMISAEVAI